MTLDQEAIHDEVRSKYAEAARAASEGRGESDVQPSCCGPDGSIIWGNLLYAADDRAAPAAMRRFWPASAAATRRPWPTSARASGSSTSGRAAGST